LVVRGRRIVLREGENIIGRNPGSDVWLDVAGVSRRHARIVVGDQTASLEDLGSKNGTTVRDGRAQQIVALQDGAAITFGPVASVYRTSTAGMSTETHSGSAVPQRPASVE
jgi:pSer/pThr/pTyr-binding forkhead associated (FHA) protein